MHKYNVAKKQLDKYKLNYEKKKKKLQDDEKNSLVSNWPGLFLGAEGRLAETRAVFSLIVAASTVFCLLKLLPVFPVTVPPVAGVA